MAERNKWDWMLQLFISKKQVLKPEMYIYQNEIAAQIQLFDAPVVRPMLMHWLQSLSTNERRDELRSKAFREMGNDLYKSKPPKFKAATEYYTKAIFIAPGSSLELSLAHANRAVVLMATNQFQAAYDDCEMAVQYSYPKENIMKVLFRQAGCSLKLNDPAMLHKVIKVIENELKNHQSRTFYNKLLMEYKANLQALKKNASKAKNVVLEPTPAKYKIESSDAMGRFLTSTSKIAKDSLVMTDTAFAFVPVYEQFPDEMNFDLDCQNCAKTNVVQFPCETCHRATYCSIQCRSAHVRIHEFECAGYKMNLWYYIGIAHLSLRTFITGFPELVDRFKDERNLTVQQLWKRIMELATTDVDSNFKYGRVISLVHNFKKMKDSKDFIRYSLTATMLMVYLKFETNFFERLPSACEKIMPIFWHWEQLAGSLIMLHMGQLVSNGHAITDLRTTLASEFDCTEAPNSIKRGKLHCFVRSTRIFTAIFPTISLLNHSCDANIRNSFNQNTLSVHANRDIEPNAEISNCYGPNYRLMNTEARTQALSDQYCFQCKCPKCEESPEDRTYHQYYICGNCQHHIYIDEGKNFWWRDLELKTRIDCSKCNTRVHFQWYSEFLAHLGKLDNNDQVEDAFENAFKIYASLEVLMGVHNELRQDIGIMILCHFIPFLHEYKTFKDRLTAVAINLLEARESKFGIHSIEFIIAATYLLDLMAIQRQYNLKVEKAPPRLPSIKESFMILSADTRNTLNQYIAQYIEGTATENNHH